MKTTYSEKVIISELFQDRLCEIAKIKNKANFQKIDENELNERLSFAQGGLFLSNIRGREIIHRRHIAVLKEKVRRLEAKLRDHE
ncbi:hypothetical protein [Photobacterium indicum]|uniref:hypothetical protein n=1 Tax=Photobacterium indicum TaxID=81447 RepID=UPI003D125A09